MLKKYCKSCGAATYYSAEDPDFCQKCGNPFREISASVKKKRPQKKKPLPVEMEEHEDEEAPINVDGQPLDYTKINSLDVEIDTAGTDYVDTFGAIAGTAGENPLPPMKLEQGKKISQKEFLRQFQKEAGAIRPK